MLRLIHNRAIVKYFLAAFLQYPQPGRTQCNRPHELKVITLFRLTYHETGFLVLPGALNLCLPYFNIDNQALSFATSFLLAERGYLRRENHLCLAQNMMHAYPKRMESWGIHQLPIRFANPTSRNANFWQEWLNDVITKASKLTCHTAPQ